MPKIDHKNKEGAIDIVKVNLSTRFGIADNQADAGWWSDRAAILSLATCLSNVTSAMGISGSCLTLSPNPHIRALTGCCSTRNLRPC